MAQETVVVTKSLQRVDGQWRDGTRREQGRVRLGRFDCSQRGRESLGRKALVKCSERKPRWVIQLDVDS